MYRNFTRNERQQEKEDQEKRKDFVDEIIAYFVNIIKMNDIRPIEQTRQEIYQNIHTFSNTEIIIKLINYKKKLQEMKNFPERDLLIDFLLGYHSFDICLQDIDPFRLNISKLLDLFYGKYSYTVSFNMITSRIEMLDEKLNDIQKSNTKIMQYITSIVDKISVLAELMDENKK
jgi:hypothetical protein